MKAGKNIKVIGMIPSLMFENKERGNTKRRWESLTSRSMKNQKVQ